MEAFVLGRQFARLLHAYVSKIGNFSCEPVHKHSPSSNASVTFAGEIFERIRLPGVLGEILAGVSLGPFALGWIHPSDTIHSLAEVGAIFVLFHAGLETSPHELIRVGGKASLVAVAGILVPFALGFAYMRWHGVTSTEAIFVGAAMVATSVGITAGVLGDLGVLATNSAKIILGAAVFGFIHDTSCWCNRHLRAAARKSR